jgi:hypothetical protein
MDLSSIQRDIAEVGAAASEGLERLQYGSYAERHPALGKYRTCPFCRQRRFEFSPDRCCNASHATSKRAWSDELGFYQEPCEPRVVEAMLPKAFMKKLLHKRHGQSRQWKIRALVARMQANKFLVIDAAIQMHVKPPDIASIPAFGEKYWLWLQKRVVRQQRKAQQLARRVNFGLINGQDGIRRTK